MGLNLEIRVCGPAHSSGLGIPEKKMLSSLPKAINKIRFPMKAIINDTM